MQDIAEYERRISAALERIARGVTAQAAAASTAPMAVMVPEVQVEYPDDLPAALDEERMANAQLQERLRVQVEKAQADRSRLDAEVERLTAELDAARMDLAALRDGASDLATELDSLKALRRQDADEVEAVLAALTPLIEEAANA